MARLLTFQIDGGPPSGGALTDDERVVDLTELGAASGVELPQDILGFVANPAALDRLSTLLVQGAVPETAVHRLRDVTLRAPLRPGKIVGVGLNYAAHVEESSRTLETEKAPPSRPVLFSKPATAVIGPGEPIRHDAALTSQLDWECELAVVIGRTAHRVEATAAADHIFGYSIINDISARDQRRSGQWFFSKGQDSYAPFGPWIVTADEIDDPQDLDFRLTVNGEEKQNSNTRSMLFSIAQLIEDISSGITLEPGDVIATGSAEGVGASFNPPQFLRPRDIVELTIEKIGTLSNPVIEV